MASFTNLPNDAFLHETQSTTPHPSFQPVTQDPAVEEVSVADQSPPDAGAELWLEPTPDTSPFMQIYMEHEEIGTPVPVVVLREDGQLYADDPPSPAECKTTESGSD